MPGEENLKYSGYAREGYTLDVGRLWELPSELLAELQALNVYANAHQVRIVDYWCGEWEAGERAAIRLTPQLARAVGEILLAAADVAESQGGIWRQHAEQADPDPELRRVMREKLARDGKQLGPPDEHGYRSIKPLGTDR